MSSTSSFTNLILLICGVTLPLLVGFIWFIVDVFKKKWLRLIWVKLSILILSLGLSVFMIPWIFSNIAVTFAQDKVMCEAMFKIALNTSILKSTKSRMYLYLAHLYYYDHRGQDAIDMFEKSYSHKQNDVAVDNLCSLYTIKGQHSYAIAACLVSNHEETAAINSILKNDYEMAYKSISSFISNSKTPTCLAYAIRGQIYRAAGNTEYFEQDFAKANEICKNASHIKEIYDNPKYFHEHYEELKKQYNFN